MTTYSAIASTEVDADSPVTATLFSKLANNPLALIEGDATAPDMQWAALQPALAAMVHDEIGALVLARVQTDTGTSYAPGDTVAGSSLRAASVYIDSSSGIAINASGSTLSGTYKCHGNIPNDSTTTGEGITLWVRIS